MNPCWKLKTEERQYYDSLTGTPHPKVINVFVISPNGRGSLMVMDPLLDVDERISVGQMVADALNAWCKL